MQTSDQVIHTPFTEQHLLPYLLHYYLLNGNAITLWKMPESNEKHLLICSEGLRHVEIQTAHRDVDFSVVCAGLDPGLDENSYIYPGLGDAGDRLYGDV